MLTDGFDAMASPGADLRRRFHAALIRLAEAAPDGLAAALEGVAGADCQWRVAHPVNGVAGHAAALAQVWGPLKAAFPDLERRDTVYVAGVYQGRRLIAATGHYCGTMRGDWLGIPATGRTVWLRYGEVWQIGPDGRAVQANLLWDVADVMRQAGVWPLAPSLGVEEMWPGPFTADGVRMAPSDPAQGRASLEQTLQMHKTLAEFDDRGSLSRDALIAMPQRTHWHPRMMWYGPAGIGTTRGLDGFVDGHQLPFRIAFHRPQGTFEEVTAERARMARGITSASATGPIRSRGAGRRSMPCTQAAGSAGCRPRAGRCSCG